MRIPDAVLLEAALRPNWRITATDDGMEVHGVTEKHRPYFNGILGGPECGCAVCMTKRWKRQWIIQFSRRGNDVRMRDSKKTPAASSPGLQSSGPKAAA